MPRDALFDAAVNRALLYALRTGVPLTNKETLRERLELWYLKTRFAYRVPFVEVLNVLPNYPGEGHVWTGGRDGAWVRS